MLSSSSWSDTSSLESFSDCDDSRSLSFSNLTALLTFYYISSIYFFAFCCFFSWIKAAPIACSYFDLNLASLFLSPTGAYSSCFSYISINLCLFSWAFSFSETCGFKGTIFLIPLSVLSLVYKSSY